MSRTTRTSRITFSPQRDGKWQYRGASCKHHGRCSVCRGDRTIAARRQAPIVEPPWVFGLAQESDP